MFSQGFDVLQNWRNNSTNNGNGSRQVGNSVSERINKFLEGMEEADNESIDDDLQSISTSFASQVGLY